MPQAPRPDGRAKKIAFAILGKPANLQKKSKKQKEIDRLLQFQETSRVR